MAKKVKKAQKSKKKNPQKVQTKVVGKKKGY